MVLLLLSAALAFVDFAIGSAVVLVAPKFLPRLVYFRRKTYTPHKYFTMTYNSTHAITSDI